MEGRQPFLPKAIDKKNLQMHRVLDRMLWSVSTGSNGMKLPGGLQGSDCMQDLQATQLKKTVGTWHPGSSVGKLLKGVSAV